MNKNKIIALLIILVTFFGPFGMLFVYDEHLIVHSAREIFLFLAWILGMISAFYISVNEPFTKKAPAKADTGSGLASGRKAA
jgi:type IV secretory pathway TrbL component